ncbi:hypothetical protein SAMN02745866_00746 [Alteromonadaceae bacterium Bs31]|nr:hypothetical protein SAMN02745866_00746 [Alteromonadaceae bacterium Bs31]
MNSSIQLKILTACVGLLGISSVYLFLQGQSLSDQLAASSQQCDLRAAALLENNPRAPSQSITIIKTKSATNTAKPAKVAVEIPEAPAEQLDKPKLQSFNESLEDIVNRKYRFLLSRLELSAADKEALLQLLIEREGVYLKLQDAQAYGDILGLSEADVADLQYQLDDIDGQIEDLLSSEDNQERYALLRDSDQEQHEFSQYTLGINSLFPLDSQQQEKVLMTRLKHKQAFEKELEEFGLDGDFPLSAEQHAELVADLREAADTYKNRFLDGVKPVLKHDSYPMDQYTLLENYTNTEFDELVTALQEKVEARGVY